ncbi:MAG: hypothetical protein IPK79_05150 [Vampirovibrionales bacterium]|nr:hypothetical protein [Vampirovibrionales bacterium]
MKVYTPLTIVSIVPETAAAGERLPSGEARLVKSQGARRPNCATLKTALSNLAARN